jgi:hypothetical protein
MPQTKKKTKKKRGNIGREIFEQVEKLVADQKIPRLTAFKQLSQKTGRRVGTVAANYYRVARKSGSFCRTSSASFATRRPSSRGWCERTSAWRRSASCSSVGSPRFGERLVRAHRPSLTKALIGKSGSRRFRQDP